MDGKVLEIEHNEKNIEKLKALASETRLSILEILNHNEMNLNEISEKLDMPASSVTVNIKKLEEAGLVKCEYLPGNHGSQKVCKRVYDNILIRFPGARKLAEKQMIDISMPVGNYKDFKVKPSCGLASEKNYIGLLDDVRAFLEPEHIFAQIIWFSEGFVVYKFPNNLPADSIPEKLGLSMEICSEYPIYKEDYPSDITVWINDKEIGTWTSPGDFGDERGKLNPSWQPNISQSGLLKIWTVEEEASFIDGKKISDVSIDQLNIQDNDYIKVKIGIKEDAQNIGGINIFGEKFGDYEQNIVLRLKYKFNNH